MNYKQIKLLADELGLIVKNELRWDLGQWYVPIDLPEGKGFECQYHATQYVCDDLLHNFKKSEVWEWVAETMKFEAEIIQDCNCGFWKN